MSVVRLWTLGNLEHKIVPTESSIEKLRSILESSKKEGGDIDIVWGPELTVTYVPKTDLPNDVDIIEVVKGE